jgi:hypothetical protein
MGGLEALTSLNATGGATATSIWALSIPSFEWAQLPVMSKATAADPRARIGPKCLAIGEHYIFYYGGRNAADDLTTVNCDKQANVAFLFDVNTLTWTDKFTPWEGAYMVPVEVVKVIGGTKVGHSTIEEPANGWSHPELETIMRLKVDREDWPGVPQSGGTGSRSNVGRIAGSVVAVVSLTLIIL